jgi:hypothetical protein
MFFPTTGQRQSSVLWGAFKPDSYVEKSTGYLCRLHFRGQPKWEGSGKLTFFLLSTEHISSVLGWLDGCFLYLNSTTEYSVEKNWHYPIIEI